VPLHPVKRRTRGYNQSEVLAAGLATRLGLPRLGRALRRIRFTSTQTSLTARQRADNVRGAFLASLPARFQQRHLLLVDDVMTTGATVSECSRCLLAAGAASVWVVTVARG
jgi:ComF family protein